MHVTEGLKKIMEAVPKYQKSQSSACNKRTLSKGLIKKKESYFQQNCYLPQSFVHIVHDYLWRASCSHTHKKSRICRPLYVTVLVNTGLLTVWIIFFFFFFFFWGTLFFKKTKNKYVGEWSILLLWRNERGSCPGTI